MKRWLKYGLILVILIALLVGVLYLIKPGCDDKGKLLCLPIWSFPLLLPSSLLNMVGLYNLADFFSGFTGLILVALFYFVIGAIIGLIVDKIKSKNQEPGKI